MKTPRMLARPIALFLALACLAGLPSASAQSLTALPASPDLSGAGVGYGISLGDYDNDGDLDVFWGVPGASNKLLANDGAGDLSLVFTFPGANATEVSITGDFNGDGYTDVLFGNSHLNNNSCPCEPNRLFINNQNGTFSEEWNDGQQDGTRGLVADDFNGDGKLDFASAAQGGGQSRVWLNNGLAVNNGFGFTQASIPVFTAAGVAAGDLDGKHQTDIVFSDGTILFADGSGGFTTGSIAAGSMDFVAIADLDGVNGSDIIFSGDRADQVRVYLKNAGAGYTAQPVVGNTTDVRFTSALGDINNDGEPDLVMVGYGTGFDSAFLSNGAGQMIPTGGLGWGGKGLAVGDLDGDGDDDVVTADPNAVFRNDLPTTTILINTVADTNTASDGVCSLREAIANANLVAGGDTTGGDCAPGLAGLDTIGFAIPGAGPHTLSFANGVSLPAITQPVVVDGCTQPGASCTGNIEDYDLRVALDAAEAPLSPSTVGLHLAGSSNGSTVRGIVLAGFTHPLRISTSNNLVERVYGGTNFAGTARAPRRCGRHCIFLAGTGNIVENSLFSASREQGLHVSPSGSGNTIRNNRIGTTADGRSPLRSGDQAIGFNQADNNVVTGNTIVGEVRFDFGAAVGNVVRGNWMGTNPLGDNLGQGSGNGVKFGTGSNNTIGGPTAGDENVIANYAVGIVAFTGSGNDFLRNTYAGNGLDVDLGGDGATANDAGDPDAGPNNLQNHPDVAVAELVDGAHLRLLYSIDGEGTPFDVEWLVDGQYLDTGSYPNEGYFFFPSGFGNRVNYLGAVNLGARLGSALQGIATHQTLRNSSELSPPVTITAANVVTEFLDEFDDDDIATNTLGSGGGFLSVGTRNVAENAGVAIFAGTDALTRVIESRDVFDPFTGTATTVTWQVQDVGAALPSTTNQTWVGIRPAAGGYTANEFIPAQGPGADGVYVAINHDPNDAANPASTHGVVASHFPGDGPAAVVLAEFEWTSYDGQSPLTITLTTTGSAYAVAFSEQINLTSGSLSGALPNAPGAGTSYVAGAGYSYPNGGSGTMTLESIGLTSGNPLVVTSTADTGAGSLRSAIAYANSKPGLDTITFELPGPSFTIGLTSELPPITDPVIVDGYSQNGSSANTAGPFQPGNETILVTLDGAGAGKVYGLSLTGHTGSRISGLRIADFGGAGIYLNSGGHQVSGNHLTGNGTGQGAGTAYWTDGVHVGGPENTIGGPNPEDRNTIVGSGGSGIGAPEVADILTIQGNFIGIESDGDTANPNFIGISSYHTSDGLLLGNLISGNSWYGMELSGVGANGSSVNDWVLSGNRIGTDATGTANRGNGRAGLYFQKGATTNLIEDNLIAFNGEAGILVTRGDGDTDPQGIQMRRNELRNNQGIGIDLVAPGGPLGITANDPGDVDAGPNGLLNFPVIATAYLVAGADLQVTYQIDTDVSNPLTVEFFVDGVYLDTPGMPDAYGAAGSRTVTFSGAENLGARLGGVLTATATDNSGNTSEISGPIEIIDALIVTSTDDSGPGSLRGAIEFANQTPGLDTISFAISGTGTQVISLASAFPKITDPVVIDGLTQAGAVCGDADFAGRNLPIVLDGAGAPSPGIFLGGGGVWIGSGGEGSIVRGLEIRNFQDYGINVSYADDVTIQCNNVGTGPDGIFGNRKQGVFVDGSRSATIGGPAGLGNVIAGNGTYELNFRYRGDHEAEGNYIGASPFGPQPSVVISNLGIGNQDLQTVVVEGSGVRFTGNVVGGPSQLVQIFSDLAPAGGGPRDEPSFWFGNYIGTDRTGLLDLSGNGVGIRISGTGNVLPHLIGGPNPGEGNTIRNMDTIGILVNGAVTGVIEANDIQFNGQGVELGSTGAWDVLGNTIANNAFDGIRAFQPCSVALACELTGNAVYGNGDSGMILFEDADGYQISQNRIGLDAANAASPNLNGIIVRGADNLIGPDNTISGNTGAGLILEFPGGTGNRVESNFIGTNPAGTSAIPNSMEGIRVFLGANQNTIGGGAATRNIISGNGTHGISINGEAFDDAGRPRIASQNVVSGNYIGLAANGADALGNGGHGIEVIHGSHDNVLNGNVIAASAQDGVLFFDAGTGNQVLNNKIGTMADGITAAANTWNGIDIIGRATGGHSIITGNTIAFHPGSGILLKDTETGPPFVNATILGNSIFSNQRIGIDLTYTVGDEDFQGDLRNENDLGDLDVGPNGKLNHPRLLRAKRSEAGIISLDVLLTKPNPGTNYTVEVFTADADAEEGKTLLHSQLIQDGDITANQSVRLEFQGTGLILGDGLVATATDGNGFTSEFSPVVTVDDFVPRGYVSATVVDLGATPINRPRGVAAAADGDFWVASNGMVQRYDVDGQANGTGISVGGGVAVDDIVLQGGTTFVIHSGSVQRLGGAAVSVPGALGGAVSPTDGYLHVVAGNQVLRSTNGGSSFDLYATLPAGVVEATSIAFSQTGTAYVGTAMGIVYALTPAAPNAPTQVWTVSGSISSLAFAEDGRLFLTTQKQVLYGFPSAPPIEFMALPGGGGDPNSLAIGPNSRLFVAHEVSGEVLRFSLPKTQQVDSPALTFVMSPSLRDMLGAGVVTAAVTQALSTWDGVVDIDSRIVFDAGTPGVERASIGDTENTITLSSDALFLGQATLGVASKLLRVRPGGTPEEAEVVTADILLNSRFHPTTGNSAGFGVFSGAVSAVNHDVQGVITHEVGHVLGLVHSSRPDATMFYSLPSDARSLTVDDRAAILRRLGASGAGYGSIDGQVISGNPATAGTPVGGALVMATNITPGGFYEGQNIHAYTDRLGNYSLSFLPPGDYRVGLFALDGSVFASKLPLTPARISRYLDTIANERNFLEEYWNGVNESAEDDRSQANTIPVSANSLSTANFITNVDVTAPAVAGISVGANPDAASLEPTIGLTFSERIVESSVVATVRPAGCAIPCNLQQPLALTLERSGRKVAVATIPTRLAPSTGYVVSISGVMDDAGNVQSIPFSSVFTTRSADASAPTVVSSTPGNGASGVSTATLVTVTFSEPVDPATLTPAGAVVLQVAGGGAQVAGTLTIAANNAISFKPSERLASGTSYELVLTGIKDFSDNTLTGSAVVFATEVNPALAVTGFGPASGALGVALETGLFIDFSEPIARQTLYPIVVRLGGTVGVTGSAELVNDGKRLVFIPAAPLAPNQNYTVSFLAGVSDLETGLESVTPASWSFTTGSQSFSWTSLAPNTGSVGAFVSLEGTGFNPNSSQNVVTFTGGGQARVVSGTVNRLTVVVPEGTVSGPVTFQNQSRSFKLYVEPETFDTAVKKASTDSAPSDVDVAPDGTVVGVRGPLAVVPNAKSGTVSLIEVETGIQQSIVVGETPLRVSVTPDGTRAYVTNFNSHSVSMIDLACAFQAPQDPGCVQTIPVGFNPLGIDVSPDGSRVFVANYSSKSVSVIDAQGGSETYNQAVRTIATDDAVTEVFTNPDGTVRWLVSEAGKSETELEPDGTLRKLQTDSSPTDVEAHPDGTGVWIGTNFGMIATEVNLEIAQADWAVKVLVSESHSSSSDVDPDGGVTKLANESNTSSTQSDPDGAGTITRTDATVSHVESSPDGAVINMVMGGGDLLIYAVPTDPYQGAYQAVAKTGTDAAASSVETSPDGSLLYVTSFTTSTVSIYKFGAGLGSATSDPLQVSGSDYGLVLLEVIQVGRQPEGIAYSPEHDIAVVANSGSDDITVLSFQGTSGFVLEEDDVVDPDLNGDGIPDARVGISESIDWLLERASGKDQKDYDKASRHAQRNLDAELWTEDAIPGEKHGNKVFDNDKQIVKSLDEIVQRDGFESETAAELVSLTLGLDRSIVENAIDAAQADIDALVCAPGKPGKKCRKQAESALGEIAKAVEELAKAEAEINDGKYDKAIDHFKKAWEHAGKSADDAAGKGFIDAEEDLPTEFALSQNYPNPFNPVTTIEFALPEAVEVRLEVFDVLGRRVQSLVNGPLDAGYHSVQFNADRLASGIYLYRIQAGSYVKVHRMVMTK